MERIILFDGICNLCSKSVNFIINRDNNKVFRFASLQSSFAQNLISNPSNKFQLFSRKGLVSLSESTRKDLNSLNSILYLEDNIFYQKSDAAFRIASHLGLFLRILSFGKILPISICDFLYDWIAKNRYQWFGKSSSCRMPSPEFKERFLD